MMCKMLKMGPTLIGHYLLVDWMARWYFQGLCSVSCGCVETELWH